MKAIRRAGKFWVSGDGRGLVSRAGTGLLVDTDKVLGVRGLLEQAVGQARPGARHRPGSVLADLSLMLADGGTRLRHLQVLAGQPGLFGKVASTATATRTLVAVAENVDATVVAPDAARAGIRRRAWEAGALPVPVAGVLAGEDAGPLCIDIDATIVIAHSDDKDEPPRVS